MLKRMNLKPPKISKCLAGKLFPNHLSHECSPRPLPTPFPPSSSLLKAQHPPLPISSFASLLKPSTATQASNSPNPTALFRLYHPLGTKKTLTWIVTYLYMYISEPWLNLKSFQDTGHTACDHLTPNTPCYHTNCLVSDGDLLTPTVGIYSRRSGGLQSASLEPMVSPQPPPALTCSQHFVWLPELHALSTFLFPGRSYSVAFTGTSSDLWLPMLGGPPSSVQGLLLFLKCMHFLGHLKASWL